MLRLDIPVDQNSSTGSLNARVAHADSVGGTCVDRGKSHTPPKDDHDHLVKDLDDANRFLFCLTNVF